MTELSEEKINIIRLIRSKNVGPITFWQLIREYKTASAAINALPQLAKKSTSEIGVWTIKQALSEVENLNKLGGQLLFYNDYNFPLSLKTLNDCPPVISVVGNSELFTKPAIAIVGGRNASLAARSFAQQLACDLGKHGYLVVSGLARGIDRSAHLGALQSGHTIAVLAGGVDVIYPPEHQDLYNSITSQGGVISEMPLTMAPMTAHFPRRNRLISGLALGTIVIEAARQSGSLITAKFTLEQGRELFCVPGSPLDPRCQGNHDLLKSGAHLVTSFEDVITVLEGTKASRLTKAQKPDMELLKAITTPTISKNTNISKDQLLTDLSLTPIHIDLLVQQYSCSISDLMAVLLELELSGLVLRDASGFVVRHYGDI